MRFGSITKRSDVRSVTRTPSLTAREQSAAGVTPIRDVFSGPDICHRSRRSVSGTWRETAPAGSIGPWGYVRLGRNRQKLGPKQKCTVDDCPQPRSSRGVCDAHSQQLRAGKPLKPLYHKRAPRVPFPHPTEPGAFLVPLSRGAHAIVDADVASLLLPFKWHLTNDGYAQATWGFDDRTGIGMHRFLWERWGLPEAPQIDHVNGDKLDNRRANLRAADATTNQWNKGLDPRNGSGLKGVSKRRGYPRWRARIRQFGKLINLGDFDSPEAAHAAYVSAAKAMRGEFARAS